MKKIDTSLRSTLVGKIRQLQMIVTVFVFTLVVLACWMMNDLKITEIQVSAWGASENGWIWNGAIILVSLAILFNVIYWVYHHTRMLNKNLFYVLFIIPSVCLLMVGIFPTVKYDLLHNIPAVIYFTTYPLIIFLLAFINRKTMPYNEWLIHLIISVFMIVLPMIFIKVFNGMAISQILHSFIVIVWNINIIGR